MKTQTHPHLRRALVALTLSALFASVPARAINAIVNDNFTGGTDPWYLNLGAATATLDNSEGWGRVRFTNGGTSRSAVNLDQPLGRPLIANVEYLIEFDAKADATKQIDILLRSSTGIHSATYGYNVGTTTARKSISYIHSGADIYDAKLSFRIGGNTTPVYIDNVVVTRKGQASTLITKTGSIPTPANPWLFPVRSIKINNTDPAVYKDDVTAGAYNFSYAGYNYGERESFVNIPSGPTHTFPVALPGADNDITQEINDALALAANAGGGTVVIPAGSFYIGTGMIGKCIIVSSDNTVIKGAGMGVTTLTVHSSYHVKTLPSKESDRVSAAFGNGVITFERGSGGTWYSGNTASNVATVPIGSAPIPLGSFTLTVTDPSNTLRDPNTLLDYTGPIVIRQIMSRKFNEDHAYVPNNQKMWRWSNYQEDANGNAIVGPDGKCLPLFSSGSFSLAYYRNVVSQSVSGTTRTLTLDVPIPHELVPQEFADTDPVALPNPDHQPITVAKKTTALLTNCGMQDLTLSAEAEADVGSSENSTGSTLNVTGLYNGLFKNIDITKFRSLAFGTTYPVNTSFINCTASQSLNSGGGGTGYGFYIRGQNLLYKNCNAIEVRHGYTTAASQTSNIVIKNCSADTYRVNSDTTSGEAVDDTHLQYAHGILWDNHYSDDAGLIMTNRSEQSNQAWETCGWGIAWNYENEGNNTRLPVLNSNGTTSYKDLKRNLIGITPLKFGYVIGAHSAPGRGLVSDLKSATAIGLRVSDGYTRINDDNFNPATDWGVAITTATAQVGGVSQRVMFEHTGLPVADSIYDIQFAQRGKILPALPVLP